ncbi:GTPase ObgE [Candidatus Kaiserbacteria bacterium]|nr:GTPase ObgE [Candidatus Kaiserbacteria bacterium]
MLIDELTIKVKAGDGGNGAVAFNKVKLSRGPTGADGGTGGSVYFEGTGDINALMVFASRQEVEAERGRDGRGQFLDGRRGEDMVLKVPTGTTVTNLGTGFKQEIAEVGQRVLAAGGGVGGRGNFKFRSATNTTPMEHEDGTKGDEATYKLELRLIADVGFVGLPNAGKSSLLNELTAAKSRVANYPFTTLEPHLGSYYGVILADIPGIIEGASGGKGLGVKFLKHIERTKVLFHLIDAESDDVVRDHKIIRKELETYNPELTKKVEHVFLTKSDMLTPEEVEEKLAALKKAGLKPLAISILETESLEQVKKILNKIKDEKGL